jgi:hypothetical protein
MVGPLRALQRLPPETWLVLQGTAAATTAWVIAEHVVGNHAPFFAPIAASSDSTPRWESAAATRRGCSSGSSSASSPERSRSRRSAADTEVWRWPSSPRPRRREHSAAPASYRPEAAGAILTVAVANGEAGTERLVDALIGVGVALLFTQVPFSPEPLALLRRAEAAALADMAEALRLTARALEHDDDDVADKAMSHLRTLRDRLSELGRTRAASGRVARRSGSGGRRSPR